MSWEIIKRLLADDGVTLGSNIVLAIVNLLLGVLLLNPINFVLGIFCSYTTYTAFKRWNK